MRRIKNHLLVVLGFGLAGAIGAGFATGTAQAIVASLVQVVNPATAPVPTLSVTEGGRVAYQSTINVVTSNTGCGFSSGLCIFSFPNVPAGHRVVVQHIGASLQLSGVPSSIQVIISMGGHFVTGFLAPVASGLLADLFDEPVLFYVDSLQAPTVSVLADVAFPETSGSLEAVTLTGYELDCTVASCEPIATQ